MDEERTYGDEVEEDIENVADAAEDIYDLVDSFDRETSGEESSLGDAKKDSTEPNSEKGSQAEAGDRSDPSSDTSEGKSQSDISNLNSDIGGTSDSLVTDAAKEVTETAAEEAASEVVSAVAAEAAEAASAEAIGAAAGTAGGPVGALVGAAAGWAIDHIGTVIAVIVGIVLGFIAFVYVCLGSWIPSVYDDATLAWNNRRSTESIQKTSDNFLGAATTDEELAESFNLFKPFFVSMKQGKATDGTEDKWDGAYLLAAYSVYKNMYAGSVASGSSDKIIEVATSQLGKHYTEQEPNPYAEYVTGREGASGAWCQYFVSWCANQAGIDENTIPKCGLCSAGIEFFKSKGQFVAESASYTPKAGDIIYFTYGHVGIVLSADDNYVYAIEGNCSEAVCATTIERPGKIMGYGTPSYAASSESDDDKDDGSDDYYSEFFSCYDTDSGTYFSDFQMIFTRFLKYLVAGEEVTYDKITTNPVDVPVYKPVYVKVVENGQTVTKQYYIYSGTETRDYESSAPKYVNVTVELEDHTIDSTTYYQTTEERITYTPEQVATKETEVVRSLLSKSTVLYVLNIPADELYKGDVGMNVTNAEYVDYLRTTIVEQLGVTDSTGTGKFIWPLDAEKYGVGVYNITDYFGYRDQPCEGASTNHKGIDIAWGNCRGSEVRAAASGTVTSAGSVFNVTIDHGDGYSTTYYHLDLVLVKAGQSVLQGEVIGYLGNTGVSTGPHLHFEIHENGVAVDPLSFFTKTTDSNGNVIYEPISSSSWYYEKHDPEEYRAMIIQAMNELGIEVTEDKVNRVIRQIETESHGDPLAVQHGYVDSNSYRTIANWTCPWCSNRSQYTNDGCSCKNYDRAHGLMQVITSTFLANKVEGHDDIYNAYDNMLAALNYIKHRYPEDFTGIGEGHGY